MFKRALLSILSVLAFTAPSIACLDCSGTLNGATLTGNTIISSLTVTGAPIISTNGFSGPGHLLTSLPGDSTEYIQISNTLQSGSTFYVSSGTISGVSAFGSTITANTIRVSEAFVSTIQAQSPLHLRSHSNVKIFIDSSEKVSINDNGNMSIAGALSVSSISVSGNFNTSGTVTALSFSGAGVGASTTNWISNLFVSTQGTDANLLYASADEVDMMSFRGVKIATVCDMSKTGVGGRGPGSGDIANRMYSAWLITNGSTVSLHAEEGYKTIPTDMPAGYTGWRKVADFFNGSGAGITPFKQRGNLVTYMPAIELLNSGSPATTLTAVNSHVNLSSAATEAFFYINVQDDTDQIKGQFGALEYVGTLTAESSFHVLATGATGAQISTFYQSIPLFESRNIKYALGGTPTSVEIRLNGYRNGGI